LGFESHTVLTDASGTVQSAVHFLLFVSHKYEELSKEESIEEFVLLLDNKIGQETNFT
jgi:hypothetical protein